MEDRDQLAVRVARLSPEKLAVLREHLKSRESTPKPPRAAYLHAPEHAPLSFAQQRIWFVEALAPGISAFNQAMKVTLHGRVDVHALQAALRAITERHDILRSRFVLRNDAPAQIVVESQQLILEPALLEHLSEPSRALDDWVAHFAHTPFKLSEEAPIRVGLLRIDDSTHVMMLVFHHIAFDAWSVGIFARELQELYFNLLNNTPPLLPPPSEQYASFATRERERVDADETARNIAYWHKQLSDAPLPDMPTDRPRGEHFVQRSASVSWVLPRGSRSNIETAARRHSVTPFIFLLTAYAVLMSRYCRQEDIVIGSSSANRDDLATENTIGPLINTLVLRIRLTGTLTVSEAIARVREVVIGALEHQGLPFDRLVAELGIRRDLRSHPLFQHAFVLSDVPASGVQLEGLDLTTEVIDTVNTAYELSVLAQMEQHSLRLTIQYSAELFDRDTVERLKSALEVIIHDLCGHPQRCLSDLSVLSPRDREQLLLKFNQTHAPRAAGATVHELFEHHCRSAPTAIAAQTDIGATTYQDLNVYANRLAHRILSRGIECEAPVCVLLDRSIDFLAAVLACLKAGATFVPIDLDYPPERMRMILDDCGATLVVTRHSWMDRLPLGGPSVLLVEDLEGTFSEDAQNPQIGVAPGNLAYIIYTSGSTGRPKGVAIEHRGVVNLSRWQARFFGLRPGARISQFASVGFDGAVGELVMALLNGGTLVFLARERLDPPAIVRALSDHRIDVAVFVPPLLRLMDPDVLDQRSCITIVSVGEHCPADLARRWAARCRFINGYGPTECTVYSHAYAVVEDEVVENGRVSIGMPIDNIRGYVLDAQLNPVPRGAIGELYLSGEGMARGYYGRAVLSAERFVPNPFAAVASRAPQELLVSSAWEEIQQFASRHASAESCRPVSMRAAPEVIEAALHAISDNDLRHRATKVLHSVTDSDAPEGLFRYLTEALNGCYRSCGINADVLRQLLGVHSLHGLRGADFGFGHGEVLESLASMGASAIGLDYVPSFVQDARERGFQAELVRIDAPEDIFRKESGIPAESLDFVLATLVLDRVADPLQLMRNMIGTLRAHGRMAIQTLMPVVPLDDGPGVYTRIDYTPPARRILRGVNAAEDCAHLAKILECSSVHDIRIYKFPYAVFSLDGLQIYECWSFAGTKSPDAHILDSCSRLYRTGDLARYRQDGAIDVLGRIDQQVKVRGFRVEIEEIEAVLRDHAGIVDAAVRAQQGAENGTRLAAYVVPRNSGAELNSKTLIRDLRAHLSARLPHFMVPADFEVLARLPLSSSGKVDKHRLADLSPGTPALRTPPAEVDPGNELMQTLAACWAQVLNRNVVRINDNLFELGADSILLVQIVAVLRKRGVDVSIDQLFRHQTVAELAAVLEAAGGCEIREPPGARIVCDATEFPLTPIQSWFLDRVANEVAHDNQAILLELRQPVAPQAVRQALERLVQRHAMLRVQLVRNGEEWRQTWRPAPVAELFELIEPRESLSAEEFAAIAARAQSSLDPRTGSVARFVLIAEPDRLRLLCVVHHFAVDMMSWHILVDELSSLLESAACKDHCEAPLQDDTTYQRWALHLQALARSDRLHEAREFWRSQRAALPDTATPAAGVDKEQDSEIVSCSFTSHETQRLESIAAVCGAQVQDVVLTALILAMRSPGPALLLDYESHGRFDDSCTEDVSRTVGWFTALFPMLLRVEEGSELPQAIAEISRQRQMFQRHGLAYGVLRYARALGSEFEDWPIAPMSFNHLGRVDASVSRHSVFARIDRAPGTTRAGHKNRFYAIEAISFIQDQSLHLELHCGRSVHVLVKCQLGQAQEVVRELLATQTDVFAPPIEPAVQRPRTLPITPIQHGMLLHCLSGPHSGVYINQVHCRLEGSLDIPSLADAWLEVIRRHAALHAGFLWEGVTAPVQFLASEPQLELIEIDWTGRDPAEHEILRDTWLVEDRRRGFRLDAPPLMRLCLVRLSSAAHLMVWTFHHLLVDGWSVGIVLKEVLASYEGRRCGKQAALPAPQPFAHQVQWAIRKSAEDRAAFWREQLKGASVMPALPIDKGRRNATDDFAASPGEEVALLSDQETGALVAFCRQYRFTMNTLVLAAWGLSLSRYATTSDVLFGVTLSGRDPDLHGMDTAVGMFINTVPLSLRVTPGATVLDWLGDVQRKQFALQSAQHSPLGNVAQWADLPRREQPFDSVVLFENYPFDASLMNFRGSVSVLDPAVIQQSNYPLILVVLPVGVVQLRISYAPMRFAAKDIQRLAEHVRLALAALIAQPRACMREISFLTPTEQMVWQTLAAGEQPSSSEACVQDLFQERCRHAAHSVAVEDKHRSLTYAQLDRQANQLAHHLIAMGIGPESTVGICVRRSLEMYVGLLAILKAGAAYLPLDPRLPPGRIATLVESAGASVVLAHGETISSLAEIGTGQLRLDESNREWLYCAEHTPVHYTHADNLAYVMFTSGSSGTPKGVLGTHRATNNCLQWMWDTYPFSEVDVCCQKTALAFGDSIQEILGPLLAGIPCVIVHDDVLLDPQKLIDQLAEHDVTRIVLVPSLLGAILKSVPDARSRVPKLTHWLASGEALSPQIANLFTALMPGCLLINMYGASELSNDVTVFEVDGQVPSVPIGTPVANMGVRILDDELSPVPTKVVGNLYARGPGLARGYLGRPDLSAQAFVPDPFAHTPGARMYRTGDLAFVDDNGQLHFAGRRDQQIKLRGVRIELGEITAALEGHPAVEQAFSAAIEGTVGERAVRTAVTWTRAQRLMNDPRCLTLPTGMPVLQHHQSETLHSFREIFVDRVYARNGVDIAPGDIVFDVGANIGLFTLFAHYEFGAKVFAFEPADASFALLRRNIELHGCSASAVKLGIAETQDVRRFIHYPHSSLMSGFHTDPERDAEVFRAAASATLADASQSERELLSHLDDLAAGRLVAQETQVQVTTISQVLCDAGVDRIDLLKIDAERSEWQVLIGIRDEDWPRIRQIVAEVEDDDGQLAAVKRLLCERGYSVSAEESTERFAGARMFTVYAIRADTQNFLRSTARHIRPAFPVGRKISAADLREHLRECLPDYMMPSSIEVLDEFPRTASGKIDRVALISQLRQVRNSHTMQLIPPETDLQRVVATVWQEILGIEAVGRDDNFFDLGGHSLLMIGVCNEIACRTGRFVSIIDVYQYPTVKGLAGLLSGANAIEDSGAVERGRRRASSRPPRRRSHQEVRG